jgi:hypothetical protein
LNSKHVDVEIRFYSVCPMSRGMDVLFANS